MDPATARIVVVGAGQAGASLVARLRALGHAGPLTLVGAEPHPPYQRPPLSKAYLKGELSRERLFLRPESFYAAAAASSSSPAPPPPPSTAPPAPSPSPTAARSPTTSWR